MKLVQTAPSLADQVYEAVVDRICDGDLSPGQHLVQEQLAGHFGVSRQPVQQAMALLKADGLVEEVGKRGMRVAELDLARMRDHYGIRAALDGLAARLAAERIGSDAVLAGTFKRQGEAILSDGRRALDAGAIRDQIRADEAFHKLIYDASGNPLLMRTAEPHWRFLRRVMGEVLRRAEPRRTVWPQHAAILDAIIAGDAALAEARAAGHIDAAATGLAQGFKEESGAR